MQLRVMKKTERKVSFEEYIKAFRKQRKGEIKKEEEFDLIKNSFVNEHGEIIYQYMCNDSKNVAMLCQKKGSRLFSPLKTSFFTQYNLGNHPEIEKILIEIDYLAAEAPRALKGKGLGRCLSIIYKVAKNTLGVLDSMNHNEIKHVKDHPEINETLEIIESNLIHAKRYHQKAARFSTQKDYLLGNIIGFVGLAIIFIITRFLNDVEIKSLDDFSLSCLIYYGSIGGGIGAIISVMNRISSGNLNLSTDLDHKSTMIIGIMRPLIGGVFGILILILFNSGFSVFTLSGEDVTKVLSNFIILSFIAGFFERFVPDILDQTKNKVLSEEEESSIRSKK